ncbi:MAG: hypothetical protein ACYCX2_02255 [Christensenellales bacterium]
MEEALKNEQYNFISEQGKRFLIAFDAAMNEAGYDCGSGFTPGFCWGRFMLLYAKAGAKSKKIAARVYIKEDGVALRLFLNGIDGHHAYIEHASEAVRDLFANRHGDCEHCHNDRGGLCRFRKTYTLFGKTHEKCNGIVFVFHKPDTEEIPDYIRLLEEFYPLKKKRENG